MVSSTGCGHGAAKKEVLTQDLSARRCRPLHLDAYAIRRQRDNQLNTIEESQANGRHEMWSANTAVRLVNVTSSLNDLAPLPLAQYPLKSPANTTSDLRLSQRNDTNDAPASSDRRICLVSTSPTV
jgi:hypothetical protein